MTQTKVVPIEPMEEMIKAVEQEIMYHLNLGLSIQGDIAAKALCKAMLEAAPSVESEPVAWYFESAAGASICYIQNSCPPNDEHDWKPLYTHPDPRIAELEAKLDIACEALERYARHGCKTGIEFAVEALQQIGGSDETN